MGRMTSSLSVNDSIDVQRIRDQFPALSGDTIYFDNAGGSQVPRCVADAIHRYLLESYVQLGAEYPMSRRCTRTVDEGAQSAGVS